MKVERMGTVKLLELTKGLDETRKKELLSYIGRLEQSEDKVYQDLVELMRNLGYEVKKRHECS